MNFRLPALRFRLKNNHKEVPSTGDLILNALYAFGLFVLTVVNYFSGMLWLNCRVNYGDGPPCSDVQPTVLDLLIHPLLWLLIALVIFLVENARLPGGARKRRILYWWLGLLAVFSVIIALNQVLT